jgi:hypothetical protein
MQALNQTVDALAAECARLAMTHDPKDFERWLSKQAELTGALNRRANQALEAHDSQSAIKDLLTSYGLTQNYEAGVALGITLPLQTAFEEETQHTEEFRIEQSAELSLHTAIRHFAGMGVVKNVALANLHLGNALNQALDQSTPPEVAAAIYFYAAVKIDLGQRSEPSGAMMDYLERSAQFGYKPAKSYLAKVQMHYQLSTPDQISHLLKTALPCAEAYYLLALLHQESDPTFAYECAYSAAKQGYHLALDLCGLWSYQGFVSPATRERYSCLSYVTAFECFAAYPLRLKTHPTFRRIHEIKTLKGEHLTADRRYEEFAKFLLLADTPYATSPKGYEAALLELFLKNKEVLVKGVEAYLATLPLDRAIAILTTLTQRVTAEGSQHYYLLRTIFHKHAIQKSSTDDTGTVKHFKYLLSSYTRLNLIKTTEANSLVKSFPAGDMHVCLERNDLITLKVLVRAAASLDKPSSKCPHLSDKANGYSLIDYAKETENYEALALIVLTTLCMNDLREIPPCVKMRDQILEKIVGSFGYSRLKEKLFSAMVTLISRQDLFSDDERLQIASVFDNVQALKHLKTLLKDMVDAAETLLPFDNTGLDSKSKGKAQLQELVLTQKPSMLTSCMANYRKGELKIGKPRTPVPTLMAYTAGMDREAIVNLSIQFLLGYGKPRSFDTAVNLLHGLIINTPNNDAEMLSTSSLLQDLARLHGDGYFRPVCPAVVEDYLLQGIKITLAYIAKYPDCSPFIKGAPKTFCGLIDGFYKQYPCVITLNDYPKILDLIAVGSQFGARYLQQFCEALNKAKITSPVSMTPAELRLINQGIAQPTSLSPEAHYLALYQCIRSNVVDKLFALMAASPAENLPRDFAKLPQTHLLQMALLYQKAFIFNDYRVIVALLSKLKSEDIPQRLLSILNQPRFAADLMRTLTIPDVSEKLGVEGRVALDIIVGQYASLTNTLANLHLEELSQEDATYQEDETYVADGELEEVLADLQPLTGNGSPEVHMQQTTGNSPAN